MLYGRLLFWYIFWKWNAKILFFIYDSRVPENYFMENKTPLTIRELRNRLAGSIRSRSYTTDVGRDFRITLYGRLGGLRKRFGTLLKKAVSFNPDINIQEFISQFVCDAQQTVDVSQMQDNDCIIKVK